MTKSLCLILKKPVTFSDGGKKIKHVFIDVGGALFIGWSDPGEELPDTEITQSLAYESARARDYVVSVSEYDSKLTYKVDLTPQRSSTTY